jgi:hypothetical protein
MRGWGWGLGIGKSPLLPLWKRGKIKGGFVAVERISAKLALCGYKQKCSFTPTFQSEEGACSEKI